MPLIEQLVGALTQHIQGDRLVDAPLESFVGALAGVHLAVHFLCDVYPELQRRDRAAPEARLGRVINACVCECVCLSRMLGCQIPVYQMADARDSGGRTWNWAEKKWA